ncbi:glycerol-3-phosphate acyltransferase [Tissierella sp. Yu-01]|uniref:glycerol-3-phosphate acyltransferase n=1 Tax=Tissierella sp. Yu-01 TaxID=3035694 RepID=UPI00240D7E52|nr:glycerol-3-phosphate acyltransferase [Tissierella sp. Yu-01]WFA08150.1 glycerol-3-phosphate acyltransferase [Tissierella sp. Yu-01]
MSKLLLVIIIGYFMGCLQWSYFLSKGIKKMDIRAVGFGNAGASNTVSVFGWKMGVAVALLDILKAVASLLIIRYLFKISFIENNMFSLYLNGTGVILGHNYPFFMQFKGGKGTASTLGMLFGIDYRIGIIGFLIILIFTFATDYIALGTMALVSFFILATIYLDFGTACILIAVFIALQSMYKHLPNFKRIKTKEESRLRDVLKRKSRA